MCVMQAIFAKENGSTEPFWETALPMESYDENLSIPFNCLQKENSAKAELGANEGIRTPDLLITNQLLYRLSHISIATSILPQRFLFVNRKMKK